MVPVTWFLGSSPLGGPSTTVAVCPACTVPCEALRKLKPEPVTNHWDGLPPVLRIMSVAVPARGMTRRFAASAA